MSSTSHPWLDTSDAPLFRVRFPDSPTADEVNAFARVWIARVHAQGGTYGVVCDLSGVLAASSAARRAIANMDRELYQLDKEFCVGTAFVVKSAIVRGFIMAVYWVTPPVYPYRCFGDEADATAWVRTALSSAVTSRAARSA